jgi:hypothetical protein
MSEYITNFIWFTNELTENPPPPDLTDIVPIQSNFIENEMTSMDSHSPIIEQSGGGVMINKKGRVMIYNLQHYQNFIQQIRY